MLKIRLDSDRVIYMREHTKTPDSLNGVGGFGESSNTRTRNVAVVRESIHGRAKASYISRTRLDENMLEVTLGRDESEALRLNSMKSMGVSSA